MKNVLLFSILLCAIAWFPAVGELTDADLDKIRLIVNDSEKRVKEEITKELAPIKADIAQLYPINVIRSLFDQVSIARHRDLALQMGLIWY